MTLETGSMAVVQRTSDADWRVVLVVFKAGRKVNSPSFCETLSLSSPIPQVLVLQFHSILY